MFTGIVAGLGIVEKIDIKENLHTLTIRLPENAADNLHTGASVAVNGCCLTVTGAHNGCAVFDVMAESLQKTNLGCLKAGGAVNIERAARFGDEIGGHVMSGHIMQTTPITRIESGENRRTVFFRLPENLRPYIFSKGFIGLDGCSLTVGDVGADEFNVHLIPETLRRTLFGTRRAKDAVNLEIDAQTQAVVDTVARLLRQNAAEASG